MTMAGALGLTFEQIEEPIDFFHKEVRGARVAWMLIAIHVAAALYHHFVMRDRTLTRMVRGPAET